MIYMMMDFRKIIYASAFMLCIGVNAASAQSDAFSFGALDWIGKEPVSESAASASSAAGAIDAILSTASTAAAPTVPSGALGALAMVAEAKNGECRAGALAYISKASAAAGYYQSGVWESAMGGNSAPGKGISTGWTGMMYAAPEWGRITSGFGYRPKFGRMHKGVDIAMSVGDTVCVPLPGVVDRISYEAGGYGHYVVVKHENGLETRYAHLSGTLVTPGDYVAAHQPIALSGNTGNSTGPHLHFETRVLGNAVDPLTVFDFAGGMVTPKGSAAATGNQRNFSGVTSGVLAGVAAGGVRGKSLDQRRTYVVKVGDTLDKIAARAGVSVLQICQLNFISETEPLQPGVMLKLRK